MSDEPSEPREYGRSVTLGALLAALLPAFVYVDFWEGSVPQLPGIGSLLAAILVGGLLGVAMEYLDGRDGPRRGVFDPTRGTGLALLVVVVLFSGLLFPRDLPVAAEVGLVALVWGGFATRLAFAYGPLQPGSAVDG